MQIKHYALSALAALSLAVVGCGDKSASGSGGANRIFDEKSGVVEMKMSMMGMEPKVTLYFDDYGNKTATTVKIDMMGKSMVQHAVAIGDSTVEWNEETMEGTRSAKTGASQNMSLTAYMNMDDARKKALNYKEIGEKQVLGKTATGFSVDTNGATVKIWQWKNIPVYMEASAKGPDGQSQTVTFEATKIDVPSDVPAKMFEVPATVKIKSPSAMGGTPSDGGAGGAAEPAMGGDSAKGDGGADTTVKK